MNKWLRWLAVILSAVLAWWIAFIVGLFMMSAAERLCPPELLISGTCNVPWWSYVVQGISSFGAALAAVLVVLVSSVVAPSHRRRVAWLTYSVGTVVAVIMGYMFIVELSAALLAGAITAAMISRKVKHGA